MSDLNKMTNIRDKLTFDLKNLKKEGFYKEEKIITSKQSNIVQTEDQKNMINFQEKLTPNLLKLIDFELNY